MSYLDTIQSTKAYFNGFHQAGHGNTIKQKGKGALKVLSYFGTLGILPLIQGARLFQANLKKKKADKVTALFNGEAVGQISIKKGKIRVGKTKVSKSYACTYLVNYLKDEKAGSQKAFNALFNELDLRDQARFFHKASHSKLTDKAIKAIPREVKVLKIDFSNEKIISSLNEFTALEKVSIQTQNLFTEKVFNALITEEKTGKRMQLGQETFIYNYPRFTDRVKSDSEKSFENLKNLKVFSKLNPQVDVELSFQISRDRSWWTLRGNADSCEVRENRILSQFGSPLIGGANEAQKMRDYFLFEPKNKPKHPIENRVIGNIFVEKGFYL